MLCSSRVTNKVNRWLDVRVQYVEDDVQTSATLNKVYA